MNATGSQAVGMGALFTIIFLTGFRLSRSGKPYQIVLFNIHKLVSLAAGVFLGLRVYQSQQGATLAAPAMIAAGAAALSFVVMAVTGGLLSVDRPMPPVVSSLHKLFPYLTGLLTATSLYLL